mgnify:CR=1 FL=1
MIVAVPSTKFKDAHKSSISPGSLPGVKFNLIRGRDARNPKP